MTTTFWAKTSPHEGFPQSWIATAIELGDLRVRRLARQIAFFTQK
jgi:hypothetical protein